MSKYIKTLFKLTEAEDQWDDDLEYQNTISAEKNLKLIAEKTGLDVQKIMIDGNEAIISFFDVATLDQIESFKLVGNNIRVDADPSNRDCARILFNLTVDLSKTTISEALKLSGPPKPDSPASRFLQDYEDQTHAHPFLRGVRYIAFSQNDFVMFEIKRSIFNPDTEVHISDINSSTRKSGYGTKALKWLTDLADKHGVSLEGHAKSYMHDKSSKTLSTKELKGWYQRNGFKVKSTGDMLRLPIPKSETNT